MNRRHLAWIATVLWAGLIFAGSSIPASDLRGPEVPYLDKLVHATEYAVLGALVLVALGQRRALILAVGLAALYGASDELHQTLVPGRDSSVYDWLADAIGATLGALIYSRWRWRSSDPSRA